MIGNKRQSRRTLMLELVKRQQQSGKSQVEFCKSEKISTATFGYWRKQYLNINSENSRPNFVALTIEKAKTPPRDIHSIEVELPNKIILRCKDWQTDKLSTLLTHLQSIE